MLKLKLQYFGHLLWKTDSLEKTLMMGKIKVWGEKNDRGWDCWMASPMQRTWVCVGFRSWWWTGKPGVLQSMGLQKFRHNWRLNWTVLNWYTKLRNSYMTATLSFNSLSFSPPHIQTENMSITWRNKTQLNIHILSNVCYHSMC